MLGADAKVYPFGAAPSLGDASGHISGSAVGIAPTPDSKGYWTVTSTGQVFQFGTAPRSARSRRACSALVSW